MRVGGFDVGQSFNLIETRWRRSDKADGRRGTEGSAKRNSAGWRAWLISRKIFGPWVRVGIRI